MWFAILLGIIAFIAVPIFVEYLARTGRIGLRLSGEDVVVEIIADRIGGDHNPESVQWAIEKYGPKEGLRVLRHHDRLNWN